MASYVPVNSVVRAIRLLKELNRFPVSTLDQLYIQTKIPKPTIIRLLQTLEAQDIVRHAPQHGTYYLTSNVLSLSSGYHAEPKLVEAAAPLMDELTKQLRWPLAIAALEGDRMAVRYSTIPESALSILHSNIGMQLSLGDTIAWVRVPGVLRAGYSRCAARKVEVLAGSGGCARA